jgi:uncharacterized protein YndB with AHSA1/START domain/dihydrofolate reductase
MNPTTVDARPGMPFIDVVREFEATPARVFRAATDPDLVARWLGPRELEMRVIEYDARTGGAYRYVHLDASGNEYAFRGVFHTVTPNERIIQTFEYAGTPDVVSVDASTYEDLGERTRLRTHTVFPTVEARDEALASGMEHGIRDSMDRLEEVVRRLESPGRSRVVVDISMSLDGYVAAAGVDLDHGLGVGGEVIHDWAMGRRTPRDAEILSKTVERTGAVIMGRRTFDIVDDPKGWNDDVGYGGRRSQADAPPVFVITHAAPEKVRLRDRFRFVTDGLSSALAQARDAAGEKDVVIMGGGAIASAFLRTGLVDVLSIHLAPVVLGDGTPLWPAGAPLSLELLDSESTSAAEHLTYRVINDV